jgi:cardiolipin synthase A/B
MDRDPSNGRTSSATCAVAGNRLTLIPDGPQRLAVLLDLVASAETRLDLYFYIFLADSAGMELRDALLGACQRGVAVTVLVDAFGSAFTPDTLFEPLIAAGARFGRFGRRRSTRYLIRNHQKMAIADGKRALIGGFNIAAPYFAGAADRTGWRDLGLRIEGPAVAPLQSWFDGLAEWTLSEHQSFRALRRMVRFWPVGDGPLRWLVGGPTFHLNGWARQLKHDLHAGSRLDMAAAYFAPGRSMMRRLCRVAKRGTVELVLPLQSDNRATIGAARHLYRRMLDAGIGLSEYRPQRLHSKLIAIDSAAYVGSANFDMRSLFLNVELMLRIEDAGFAQAVRAEIDGLRGESRRIDRARYQRMAGPVARLRWWFDHLLVGVLDYTVTRRLSLFRDRQE